MRHKCIFLANKYYAPLTEVTGLRDENKELEKEVQAFKAKESAMRRSVNVLSEELLELNEYDQRMNLQIHGVKVIVDENTDKLDSNFVLENLAHYTQVEFNITEIHQAHHLQPRRDGKLPTILFQFHLKTARDQWLEKGRNKKLTDILFGENLRSQYRQLFRDVKSRCQTYNYKCFWVKGGGQMVRKNDSENNVIVIKSYDDLMKVK